jgi:putative nucleotidyltransferase with HDIG domain
MAIPTRRQAAEVLLSCAPPSWFVTHCSAVAEVAAFLAMRVAARGEIVDRRVVEAAALLHDIDKILPTDDPVRTLPHGWAGARWLAEHGLPELSAAVADHPATRLVETERIEHWFATAGLEERIVAYADKRAGPHLEPLEARFGRWAAHHPAYQAELAVAHRRAQRLEREVCEVAGIAPTEVRRLHWARAALREAASRSATTA